MIPMIIILKLLITLVKIGNTNQMLHKPEVYVFDFFIHVKKLLKMSALVVSELQFKIRHIY